ncbi:hypothetical protein B5P44_01250 [Mycobacterium sp. CBMA 213]|uniref:Uncharacterized protein n=1 Tax=Mycolicibacterium sp. CBMA 213 TaxID=1968788 RepID=A0A343VRP5_9MYCO|nr:MULTISPECIES: hypothetical protein [unclassified Mycolicibacterium]AVN58569.1 hypothetical protein B5P44_p00274 [Mycolicibacterium sp. CBMA 213]MUL61210.1 hypothetical protein [Mycolicibacterium sp. CBMA 335]MUM03447.1 hypothetical protein [Mycolicibacterium sp. CBMA 213]
MLTATDSGEAAAHRVADYLQMYSFQWANEADLQRAIWDVLQGAKGTEFADVQREVRLSGRDRPDFVVRVGEVLVAIEVKVAGSRGAVLRQLGRYCEHDAVDAVVFAGAKRAMIAGFPARIHQKPVLAAYVGTAV